MGGAAPGAAQEPPKTHAKKKKNGPRALQAAPGGAQDAPISFFLRPEGGPGPTHGEKRTFVALGTVWGPSFANFWPILGPNFDQFLMTSVFVLSLFF